MRFFVPAVGYRIKLTSDWSFDLFLESRNDTLMKIVEPSILEDGTWKGRFVDSDYSKGYKRVRAFMPTGTVLEVDRVYVRTANKTAQSKEEDYDSITFKVIEHPTLETKKRIRFWAKLDDVNTIEYELPPDHTAGKDNARENAKKPKKLTPEKIRELVQNAIWMSTNRKGLRGDDVIPAWFTKDLIYQFKAVEAEWNRLRQPWEQARTEQTQAQRLAELEHQIKTGHLSLPIAYAGKVNSIEDLKNLGLYETYFHGYHRNPNVENWTYIVPYSIMAYGRPIKYERQPDGTGCRTYRPQKSDYGWEKDAPDVSHIWVKVYSDVEGINITRVEAGFDAVE